MAAMVVDCSIVLAWTLREKDSEVALDVLDHAFVHGVVVPSLWPLEIANGLIFAVRQRRLKQEQVDLALANIGDLPVVVDRHTHDRAWTRILALAVRHELSAYDAAYLELATREGCVLATLDTRLAKAAEREGLLILPS